MRHAAAWGLTRFTPATLSRWAGHLPGSGHWAGLGEKLHKGASVMSADSVDALYQGMVATGWFEPNKLLNVPVAQSHFLQMPELLGLSDVQRMMVLDGLNYLPDDILTKVDRAAMGVSLETRVPFLDHRVVEFAWRLPMAFKLRPPPNGLVTKWALRPVEQWLRGPLREWAEDMLSPERLKRDGYLNAGLVRQKWAEHLSGSSNHQHALWCVLMFQAWLSERGEVMGKLG